MKRSFWASLPHSSSVGASIAGPTEGRLPGTPLAANSSSRIASRMASLGCSEPP